MNRSNIYLELGISWCRYVVGVNVQGAGEHGGGGRLPGLREEANGPGDDAHETG